MPHDPCEDIRKREQVGAEVELHPARDEIGHVVQQPVL
jgi:hypothetical protein